MAVRRRVIVRGVVQGVGFRFFVAREARRLGIAGFVRNLPDGTVETELEGDETAIERMLDAVREGPPGARVDALEVTGLPVAGSTAFEIARA